VLNLRKYLPSKKRSAQIVVGLVVLFLVGWWWEVRIKAASARRFVPASELDRIQYAIASARAWHVTTIGTLRGQPFQTDQDVVCPFQSHAVTRGKDASGASTLVSEIIETQDKMYAREGDAAWSSEPKPGTDKCQLGPMAGPTPLISTLAGLRSATLVRGAMLPLGGNSCRVWNFVNSSGILLASVCVDDATHLPYELKMGALEAQYSNWNLPLNIEAPIMPAMP
jgi:hypothetical protein